MRKMFSGPLTAVAAIGLVGGCSTPGRIRLSDERDAFRRATEADEAIIARSYQEIDRYRAHLAAGLEEQRRKDERIAALAAELRRVQARCDTLTAQTAGGRVATTSGE